MFKVIIKFNDGITEELKLAAAAPHSPGSSSAPQNLSNFFWLYSLELAPIISEMRLQQWPSFAWELFALCFHQRDWVSQMHCLTMPSPAPIRGGRLARRIRGAGPLWLARAEHRCQLPSVMIAYLWTFNLSKACCLAEGSRRFGVLNRFDNRHYHCEGPGEKHHQCVNCGWRCKLSLLISFNTCFASLCSLSFRQFGKHMEMFTLTVTYTPASSLPLPGKKRNQVKTL